MAPQLFNHQAMLKSLFRFVGMMLLLCSLTLLFNMDAKQQSNYQNLRQGYMELNAHNYTAASKAFTDYLSSHNSTIYWWLVENINNSTYSRLTVYHALQECNSEIEKDE